MYPFYSKNKPLNEQITAFFYPKEKTSLKKEVFFMHYAFSI